MVRRADLGRQERSRAGLGRGLAALVILLGTTGAAAMVAATPACACSCVAPDEAIRNAERADVVFTGTVSRIDRYGWMVTSSSDPIVVTFQVDGVYQGRVAEWVDVATVSSEASCGFPFRPGERYVVYADAGPDGSDVGGGADDGAAATAPYRTGLCSGTAAIRSPAAGTREAFPGAEQLDPRQAPRPGAEFTSTGGTDSALGIGLTLVVALIGLPVVLAWRARRLRTSTEGGVGTQGSGWAARHKG